MGTRGAQSLYHRQIFFVDFSKKIFGSLQEYKQLLLSVRLCSFFSMNKEHIVKMETLVSLGVFLRHWTSFEKLQMLLFIKNYTPINGRVVKHTLFPYFFTLLYGGEQRLYLLSLCFIIIPLFPILFLYTSFCLKLSLLVSYMEMRNTVSG